MAAPRSWEIHVPDGTGGDEALARTTDLAVVAHPDDLELLLPTAILACRDDPGRWFCGVVCTDGGGTGDAPAVRAAEQRDAARLGGFGALVMLGHRSDELTDPEARRAVEATLGDLLFRARPVRAYTHAPTDKHPTHVAVALATVAGARAVDAAHRPATLLGVEGWRDLDWLPDDEKVHLDLTGSEEDGVALARCFPSQLAAKRYDRAARGRRQANATFADPRAPDAATELTTAIDLTALLAEEGRDLTSFALAAIDRFRDEVATMLQDLR